MRPIFQNVSMSAQWKEERYSEGTGVSLSRHFEGKGWSESSVGFYSGWIAECMMTSFLHRHHIIVITSYSWRKCCRVIANNLRDVSGGDRGATDAASGRRTQEIRLFCHQRRWSWGNCHSFFIEQECIEFIYCQYTPAVWRVISNSLPLWKKWQYTALSRDELENMPPSAICTPRPSRLPQAAYFPIHPFSRQCNVTIFFL